MQDDCPSNGHVKAACESQVGSAGSSVPRGDSSLGSPRATSASASAGGATGAGGQRHAGESAFPSAEARRPS